MAQTETDQTVAERERYQKWFSLLQQTFGRSPGETQILTEVALVALAGGAAPDEALAAARVAAASARGEAVLPSTGPVSTPLSDQALGVEQASVVAGEAARRAPATPSVPQPTGLAAASAPAAGDAATPVAQPEPWWTTPLLVGVFLLVFPPLGLYLLWTSSRFPEKSRRRVTIIVASCWVVVLTLVIVAAINASSRA